MMKRKLILTGAALSLAVAMTGCGGKPVINQQPSSQAQLISMEAAQEVALKAANIAAEDAAISATTLNEVAGTSCYKVEFTSGDYAYAYTVNAETGAVMEMSSRMETSVADITAELNKLETAFDSTKIAMEEVSAGSGESAAAIQQQTAQTEAIQEKVNTVSEVAETIGNNMEHTIEILDAGKEEMTGLKEQAEDSARNSELAAQKLETLDHYMQEMHSIVEIISKIANQTSLLALNASIEAARAGEAGRGFSVVATEISGMATQTKDATGNIAELIQNVSGAIGEVVTVIRQMIDGIGSQREGTMRAADSFTAIEDSSYMIVDNLGELLQIVEALKTANQEIVDSVQTISATTEEVSAHASETLEAEERNREILQKITENMNSMVKK